MPLARSVGPAIVVLYLLWASLAFNEISPNGYYNYLARGWIQGQLHIPLNPAEFKMDDMVLFEGKYYLYHGVGPCLFAFYPYRLLTKRDLPEPVAVFLFVALAYFLNLLTLHKLHPQPPPLYALALGLGSGIPFLLHRIWVYEVAIAFAWLTVSASLAWQAHQRHVLSGLCAGLLALSRPHLLILAPALDRRAWPWVFAGVTTAFAHNYLRFHSPFDFGLAHLIAGPGQQLPAFSPTHILPSLYLFLAEWPRLQSQFPFFFLHRDPPIPLPPNFFHENMLGALWLAPFVLARRPLWRWGLPALAVLIFLSSTGWVTERYLIDFLPLLVLASLAGSGPRRLSEILICLSLLLNVLLHLQGPYNHLH